MIEFRTLGTPDLRDDSDGHGLLSVLAQPKRVGLLAYVVMAEGGRPVSRDKLQAVFWPEASADRARNSLKQAVFVLRRAMGDDFVVANGEGSISVNADRLGCDAWRFEEHIAAGEKPEALALYGGSFLDGLYVSGAPAFERWLEAERARHRGLALTAACELTAEAESAGKLSEALEWARQAASLAPYDEGVHRRLLRCLLYLGNRAGAIRAYEAFAAGLERDLGFEPSTETQALFELAQEEPTAASLAIPIGADGLPPTARLPTTRARGGRFRAAAYVGTAIAFLTVGGLVGRAFERSMATQGGSLESNRVLVLPFTNQTGDGELDRLGNMAADWITQGLAETGLVRAVSTTGIETAEAFGELGSPAATARALAEVSRAAIAVYGSFYLQDDSLAFQAQVTDVASGELLRAIGEITAPIARPKEAIETLRRRTTGALATVLDPRLSSWASAASQPPSYEAYQLYADGLDALFVMTGSSMKVAADYFHRAAALDTTFLLPLLWALYALDDSARDSLAQALDERRDRLTRWESALLDAHLANQRGDLAGEYRAYSRAVELTPASEWNSKLAGIAHRLGRPREAVDLLSEVDPELGWLAHGQGYWVLLTKALHSLGYHEQELKEARRGRLQLPERTGPRYREARALAALGRTDELWLWIERRSPNRPRLIDVVSIATELRFHGHDAEADRVLELAFEWYDQLPESEITGNDYALAIPLAKAGREDDGLRLLEVVSATPRGRELVPEPDEHPFFLGLFGVIAAIRGDTLKARAYYERLEEHQEAGDGLFYKGDGPFYQAVIAAHLGEKDLAVRLLGRAHAKGTNIYGWSHAGIFEPLWNYAPFQELVRPKG